MWPARTDGGSPCGWQVWAEGWDVHHYPALLKGLYEASATACTPQKRDPGSQHSHGSPLPVTSTTSKRPLAIKNPKLQSVPVQMRSTLRTAFRAGLQLVADASSADSALRGWKLFYLAARMLLRRSRVPAAELDELFRWPCLLAAAEAAMRSSEPAATRTDRTDAEARAARATEFVHLGELSAAARALVSEPLAPGSPDTLRELRDPANRPQEPSLYASRPGCDSVPACRRVCVALAAVPRLLAARQTRHSCWAVRRYQRAFADNARR